MPSVDRDQHPIMDEFLSYKARLLAMSMVYRQCLNRLPDDCAFFWWWSDCCADHSNLAIYPSVVLLLKVQ